MGASTGTPNQHRDAGGRNDRIEERDRMNV